MFDVAGRLPVEDRFYLDRSGMAQAVSRLSGAAGGELHPVSVASGAHCHWFVGPSVLVFICGTWSELGAVMSPVVQLWGESTPRLESCRQLLTG
ncbi:hypothetical protein [Micromonospora matsumotoense]|uniref:hypothetical protein n=1 Tax=Micromonospora matsumotoense TaxID=121616 RepID=UPI003404BF1C